MQNFDFKRFDRRQIHNDQQVLMMILPTKTRQNSLLRQTSSNYNYPKQHQQFINTTHRPSLIDVKNSVQQQRNQIPSQNSSVQHRLSFLKPVTTTQNCFNIKQFNSINNSNPQHHHHHQHHYQHQHQCSQNHYVNKINNDNRNIGKSDFGVELPIRNITTRNVYNCTTNHVRSIKKDYPDVIFRSPPKPSNQTDESNENFYDEIDPMTPPQWKQKHRYFLFDK
jgi:hypothetical protein